MERLCKEDRRELVWAMRKSLLEQVESSVLTESADVSAKNFILNEATYEQMLNLCFNPNREEKYLPASVLEQVAVGTYEEYVEEALKFAPKTSGSIKQSANAAVKKLMNQDYSKAEAEAIVAKRFGKRIIGASQAETLKSTLGSRLSTQASKVGALGKRAWATKKGKAAAIAVPTLAVGSVVAKKLHDRQKAKK